MSQVIEIHLRPVGIYMESKHSLKDILFEKGYTSLVSSDSVIILLLVLLLKIFSDLVFMCNALLILRN